MINIELRPELFETTIAADKAPHIVAQEQQILGYLLQTKPENARQIFDKLASAHFFYKPHHIIFETAYKCFIAKKEVDIIWVSDYLQENKASYKGLQTFFERPLEYNVEMVRNSSISTIYSFESKANALLSYHWEASLQQSIREKDFESVKKYTTLLESVQNKIKFSNATDLLNKQLEMPQEIIESLLYGGVTLLAGKPKLGKSWLMLELAFAVAAGGYFLGKLPITKSGDVLYCALEDNEPTLQSRLNTYLTNNRLGHHDVPKSFYYTTQGTIKKVNEGGISQLEQWCKQVSNPCLIIVDTMKSLKPTAKQIGYDSDYDSTQPYRELVDKYGVAILLVHHARKAEATSDPFDAISGSVGLSGSVDTNMLLNRARHENAARLQVTGRLMKEQDIALSFNDGVWTYLGDGQVADANALERQIIDAIKEGLDSPNIIAKEIDAKILRVRKCLRRMLEKGLIKQSDYGKYQLIGDS
jgi:RecA-family ATPase